MQNESCNATKISCKNKNALLTLFLTLVKEGSQLKMIHNEQKYMYIKN